MTLTFVHKTYYFSWWANKREKLALFISQNRQLDFQRRCLAFTFPSLKIIVAHSIAGIHVLTHSAKYKIHQ